MHQVINLKQKCNCRASNLTTANNLHGAINGVALMAR